MDIKYKNMDDNELLEAFKKEYTRLNYPTMYVFNKDRNKEFPCTGYLEKRLNFNWNSLLEKCDFKLHYINNKDMQYYKEKILQLTEQLEHTPTKLEIEKNVGSISTICKAFNVDTYNNVLEALDLEKNLKSKQEFTREELKAYYMDLSSKLGHPATAEECKEKINYIYKEFNGSLANIRKECGYYKNFNYRDLKYSNKELDKFLIIIYKKYKRIPTTKELETELKNNKYCSKGTLFIRYNTNKIEELFKKALEYNYFRNNKYAKNKIVDLYEVGEEVNNIATLVKTNRTTIYNVLRAKGININRKQEATRRRFKAIELYKAGMSLREIDNILYKGNRRAEGIIYKHLKSN
ncbi:MAG: hypothetical protein KHZ90_08595 [Veillonella parvula]|uniref:Uncharacterized protein n=2 Tax=Veillonella parvula TaxID=29466 RepID=A0A942WV93_VEIPA|nr:hypothetical protein [Veillonella parvula]